jgi:hypothetical protein
MWIPPELYGWEVIQILQLCARICRHSTDLREILSGRDERVVVCLLRRTVSATPRTSRSAAQRAVRVVSTITCSASQSAYAAYAAEHAGAVAQATRAASRAAWSPGAALAIRTAQLATPAQS